MNPQLLAALLAATFIGFIVELLVLKAFGLPTPLD
jgi:hypothetical protein